MAVSFASASSSSLYATFYAVPAFQDPRAMLVPSLPPPNHYASALYEIDTLTVICASFATANACAHHRSLSNGCTRGAWGGTST